ncbi:hypothetical protein CEXT_730661 [Caerostris extrusa]|uniref:Uncharacterized protein n=1 Tax=Caerostris extrusa TaxID=172846 RepID=A0AAV4QM02_CAEEX|nr:hypothetical protein CEXT_730661 [Caerostris extrusa]
MNQAALVHTKTLLSRRGNCNKPGSAPSGGLRNPSGPGVVHSSRAARVRLPSDRCPEPPPSNRSQGSSSRRQATPPVLGNGYFELSEILRKDCFLRTNWGKLTLMRRLFIGFNVMAESD